MEKNKYQKEELSAIIEAILFFTAEHFTAKKLATATKTSLHEVEDALTHLKERLSSTYSGIRLISLDGEYVLGTTPEASAVIEEITKEELSRELSKAALETLSIVCYSGPLTRSEIDYIRGVNSTFILRNLLIRGIVEKKENPRDLRAALYAPTTQALAYMGVSSINELPDYENVTNQIELFKSARGEEDIPVVSEHDDSSESIAISCDADGDGFLSSDECIPEVTATEEYADSIDESLASGQYSDNGDSD